MGIRRKIFFNLILMMAIVISVFATAKITVILNIPIACSFFVFPFSFLALIVINELGGGKEALISLLSATGVLIITYALLTLVVNLPNQVTTINEANAIQSLVAQTKYMEYFIPNARLVIGSVLGLLLSGLISVGIYSSTNKYTFKIMSCFLATLVGLLVFNAIFVVTTQFRVVDAHDFTMSILNRFIFSVIWTVIISILFVIFSHHKKIENNIVEEKKEIINEDETIVKENKTRKITKESKPAVKTARVSKTEK